MKDIKCECGHVNPEGTILCEECGRILDKSAKESKMVDMRYEGSARRSQTYNKSVIDKIWNFFSSVKVGVTLIGILLAASAIGTIFPQEAYIPKTVTPEEHYADTYGIAGTLYYELGFHNLYSSWWYLTMIAMLGISLTIASIDRVVPLYRSLKKQKVTRHEGFMHRQRIFGITKTDDTELGPIKERLEKRHYKVREENGNLLAEKARFSRWGPYVNHLGLIIFLIGCMLRFVPGMYIDKTFWVREGERLEIPGTNGQYYLQNNEFIVEVYDNEKDEKFAEAIDKNGVIAKNYQSNVTLYERTNDILPGEEAELKKIKDAEVKVNFPLKHDRYALYQVDYKLDELSKMSFNLMKKDSEKTFGEFTVDLNNPQKKYKLKKGYTVELKSYFPDFDFDDEGKPITVTKVPNNPAFIFNMITPDKPEGETSFVAIKQNLEPLGENDYKVSFAGIETRHAAALTVRKDMTLGLLFLGGGIFMIGVVQGAYWNHRRIWIRKKDGEIWLAGHTNKNWHGLKRDIAAAIEGTNIDEPADQADGEGSSDKGENASG